MRTSQGSTISRRQIKKSLCLRFAPTVPLTNCVVNEARRDITADIQQRLNPLILWGRVNNTDLSNGRILAQMSRPSVQKHIKGSCNTYQMQMTSSKTETYTFLFLNTLRSDIDNVIHRECFPSPQWQTRSNQRDAYGWGGGVSCDIKHDHLSIRSHVSPL